jgi:hypothetical protein
MKFNYKTSNPVWNFIPDKKIHYQVWIFLPRKPNVMWEIDLNAYRSFFRNIRGRFLKQNSVPELAKPGLSMVV